MKKASRFKHARTMAWLMAVCLAMTSAAPGLTAFAAEEYESISVNDKADPKDDGESSDPASGHESSDGTSIREETQSKEDKLDKVDTPDKEDTLGKEDTEGKTEDSTVSSDDAKYHDDEEGSSVSVESDADSDIKDDAGESDEAAGSDEDPAAGDDIADSDETSEEASETIHDDQSAEEGDAIIKDDAANVKEAEEEDPDELDGELENDIQLLHASPSEAVDEVCSFGGKTYPSIASASDAIRKNGGSGTIKLLTDNVENIVLDGKNARFKVTLDMNGYDLYGKFDVKGGADITFANGTVYSGELNNWIYASGDDDMPTRLTLSKNATINAAKYGLCIGGVTGSKDHNGTGFVVTVDGTVEVTEPESAGIWVHGNMQTTSARICDVTVNGTVKSVMEKGCIGIAVNGWGNVTINKDARIMGGTAIEVRAGSLTVNGGTIIGSTETFENTSNTNGSTSVGGGIIINEHITNLPITVDIKDGDISGYYAVVQDNTEGEENKINMTVTGGTFTGYNEECAILLNEYTGNEEKFSIFGGIFKDNSGGRSDISAYLPSGYELDENGNVASKEPDAGEGGSEETPGEGSGSDIGAGDGDETVGSDDNESAGGNTGSSGHHSSGGSGGGGSYTRPAVSVPEYVGDNGMKAEWSLNGFRFTKTDGTHPSNEYLIIDGVIYAFYTNGYAVSSDNGRYYSEDVIPAIEDIPVVTGTWDLCGWSMRYSDGSYPSNDWAHLTHDGRSDWYYFDADGWMETGWKQIGGYWYYFGEDGAMLSNTQTPDGHTVDADGRMIS